MTADQEFIQVLNRIADALEKANDLQGIVIKLLEQDRDMFKTTQKEKSKLEVDKQRSEHRWEIMKAAYVVGELFKDDLTIYEAIIDKVKIYK